MSDPLHRASSTVRTEVNQTLLQANTVYRLGNWEYSYLYRDSPASAQYAALRYGAWVLELKAHLQAKVKGTSKVSPTKYERFFAVLTYHIPD